MIKKQDIKVSFEFFPPATAIAEAHLWEAIEKLAPLLPNFVSVTYGAGGTTRERTHNTLKRILQETALKPAAHLTCVSASKEEVNQVIQSYYDIGVRHIVALRGDSQAGVGQKFTPHPDGYHSSIELIKGIKAISDFEISVAAYPERHPESPNWETEIDFLKRKIDAGATRAITQFFFVNDDFERYLERITKAGITIPIIPGIVPITNFEQTRRFALKTGASIPDFLINAFAGLEEDAETRKLVGMIIAITQIEDLKKRGLNQFHFYTMNKADMVFALCHVLGIRPVA